MNPKIGDIIDTTDSDDNYPSINGAKITKIQGDLVWFKRMDNGDSDWFGNHCFKDLNFKVKKPQLSWKERMEGKQ